MKNLAKFSLIMFIAFAINITPSFAQSEFGSFTDPRDGHVYRTAEIAGYIWMSDNLAYKASSGCYALNDADSNVVKYGYLYTFETANNVCPQGWHLPTVEEYQAIDNLPYASNVQLHKGNVTGFELILSSGYRNVNGEYASRYIERFWTSMGYNNLAYCVELDFDSDFSFISSSKQEALSVRCVKNK